METCGMTPVLLDRAGGDGGRCAFVAVNGKAWQIPRGTPVMVPWFVAEELRRSAVAAARRDEFIRRRAN